MMGLTNKQADLMAYLRAYRARTGTAPTLDEMASHSGLKSKSGVHPLLTALEKRGYIRRIKGHARAIEILIDAPKCPHCGEEL